MIYNQQLEAQVLSGLIHAPEVYPEVASFLKPEDFQYEVNEVIYTLIRNSLNNKEILDKTLLIGRLADLSITFRDNISPSSYIDALAMNKVSAKATIQSVKELKKFSLRRNYCDMSKQIINQMKKAGDWQHQEIISFVDKLIYNQLDDWNSETDVINLFDDLYDLIEERGNNPRVEVGIESPYPAFNDLYGGFKQGDVYVFAARPGEGKTTFLNNTGFKLSNMGSNKIPCLILDTEMGQDNGADVKFRLASSLTGINPWYFDTGNWRKHPAYVNTVRNERINGKTLKERIAEYDLHYRYLTNASIDNIISTIKRWYYSHVGRGNPCVIVYDYIKMASEGGDSAKEYQIIGDKVNRLKELVGSEVNAPLLTAIQLNRLGDNRGSSHSDTSSAISTSDRVLWFASYVAIFRKKTLEEIAEETDQFGTHKLITLKSRFQGKDASGHNIFVKKPDGNVTYNFLNFTCDNFDVREKCGAEEMYSKIGSHAPPKMPSKEDREEKKIPPQNNPFEDK